MCCGFSWIIYIMNRFYESIAFAHQHWACSSGLLAQPRLWCQYSCCSSELLEVFVNDSYCIWSSVMQRLKNILGSRKKGAQEPHAAREPRNDYQGYTTSNLKGTPPWNACLTQRVLAATVCARCSFSFSAVTFMVLIKSRLWCVCFSFQKARCWCRTSPGAWGMWPSTWTPRATLCSSSSLMSRYPAAASHSYWWMK